jgi:hypothetical protein
MRFYSGDSGANMFVEYAGSPSLGGQIYDILR